MDVTTFLHSLRQHVVSAWQDQDTIVRFEVDKDTKAENIILVIVCHHIYQPIRIDPEDKFDQALLDFCLGVFRETSNNPPQQIEENHNEH